MQLLFFVPLNDKVRKFVASKNYTYTLVNQRGQEAQFRAAVCCCCCFFFQRLQVGPTNGFQRNDEW